MRRILIVSNHFFPYKGGLENFALEMGKGLLKKGIQVDVLTFNYNKLKDKEKIEGMNVIRIPCISILGETYSLPVFGKKYKTLIKEVLLNKYDTLFTNTRFFTISFLGLIYSKILKKNNKNLKYIHIEHGNRYVIHSNPVVTMIAWLYDQTLGRIIFSSADTVIGISKPCVDFSKRLGAKKTTVIYNSIHTALFKKKKTNLREKLGIKKDELVIINGVGRLIYAKGLQDTITATKDMKNVVVITIGWGPYKEKLEAYAKANNVKTIFTGILNQKKVIEYLSIADIFINPSYSEGLPTCVLEAGAMGLPVIATDVGGTREIISNKDEGILFKPKDITEVKNNITLLSKNKKLRQKLGENIKKKIRNKFDWETSIKKIEEII